MNEEKLKLLKELNELKEEHKDIEKQILESFADSSSDINIKRLQKRKKTLIQRIEILEDNLFPDITA